jgi:hypothetical protein
MCSKTFLYMSSLKKHIDGSHQLRDPAAASEFELCPTHPLNTAISKPDIMVPTAEPFGSECPSPVVALWDLATTVHVSSHAVDAARSIPTCTSSIIDPVFEPQEDQSQADLRQSRATCICHNHQGSPSLNGTKTDGKKPSTKPVDPRKHLHVHAESCGHLKIWHNGHADYIHDGELHSVITTG